MKIKSHPVVVNSVNPKTKENTVIEVTNLLAIPHIFHDFEAINSDEIKATEGYFTLIGGHMFRLNEIPAEQIKELKEGQEAPLMVTVPWDQIKWKDGDPHDKEDEKVPPAPPELKPDELE